MLKILTEASGSLTSAYLIKAIKEAGYFTVASDIDPHCVGRFLANDFIEMPVNDDPELWNHMVPLLLEHQIKVVIPSLDETLLGWGERKNDLKKLGIYVILSDKDTVRVFQDKWLTYQFFLENGIPTPATSLEQIYPLIKPRKGRGSQGVRVISEPVNMEGMISQELIDGEEFTVDVFCDKRSKPVYIVPRKRWGVKDGKSTGGIVINHYGIIEWIKKICNFISFTGPINIQCFVDKEGTIKFLEINPRIAGGMALAFAATENWIVPLVDHFLQGKEIIPKPVQYGLEMKRYYDEVFIPST